MCLLELWLQLGSHLFCYFLSVIINDKSSQQKDHVRILLTLQSPPIYFPNIIIICCSSKCVVIFLKGHYGIWLFILSFFQFESRVLLVQLLNPLNLLPIYKYG